MMFYIFAFCLGWMLGGLSIWFHFVRSGLIRSEQEWRRHRDAAIKEKEEI